MPVSTTLKQEAFTQETGDGLLTLLTISHADLGTPIRVVNDTKTLTSRGETFAAFPFDISLPSEPEDGPPSAKLTIDNVSQEIVQAIRTITSAASVLIEVVRMSDFETVEMSWNGFILRNVRADELKVTGDLVLEFLSVEAYPNHIFTPAYFPGLLAK